jgi:hypothetical protein
MIMNWNCYRKRPLGQEHCENNLKFGAACSHRLAQVVRLLICLPFLFNAVKCLHLTVNYATTVSFHIFSNSTFTDISTVCSVRYRHCR